MSEAHATSACGCGRVSQCIAPSHAPQYLIMFPVFRSVGGDYSSIRARQVAAALRWKRAVVEHVADTARGQKIGVDDVDDYAMPHQLLEVRRGHGQLDSVRDVTTSVERPYHRRRLRSQFRR